MSRLERAGHRRNLTQRAAGTLNTKSSFLMITSHCLGSMQDHKSQNRKKTPCQLAKVETDEGETFFYDDPSLGGSGQTQEKPRECRNCREYVRVEDSVARTEAVNEEWVRTYGDDGSVLYTSNTGKSQKEGHQGLRRPWHLRMSLLTRMQSILLNLRKLQDCETPPYEATGDNQTTIKEGEVVVVLEGDAGGWTGVQSTAGAGYVPSSYLEQL